MKFILPLILLGLAVQANAEPSTRCFVQGTAFYVDLEPMGFRSYKLTLSMEGRVIDQAVAKEILTIGGSVYSSPSMQLANEVNSHKFESPIVSGECIE